MKFERLFNPMPLKLVGRRVALVPLEPSHADDLAVAVSDGELWRLWYTVIPAPERMKAEIERRLALQSAGTMVPFAIVDTQSGRAVGMTTYMAIDRPNRRLEVGSTWLARSAQRTAINSEAKLLLLTHAFEALGAIAVELRTPFMNQQSRRAIERLGAKLDGVLRSHMIMADGSLRDTCVYSILAHEWPGVWTNLQQRLAER